MGSRKWLMVALVACGLATACQDYNTNLSVQTSSSTLIYVSPQTATVGGQGFTITANGTGFTTGAEILWNGVALTTTVVSSIQLTAPVPASDLTSTGTVQINVRIPGSATSPTQNIYSTTTSEVSNLVLFTIGAAPGTPPAITSLSPNSAPFCGNTSSFTLTVTGTGFTSDSVVNWNGLQRTPVSQTATQLTASILPSDTVGSSPAVVTVSNSAGTSNSLQFTIASPSANLVPPQAISSLAPSSTFAGSSATSLVVTGSGGSGAYLPCSVVKWTGTSGTTTLPTQYTSATQLTATIPAADLQAPGTAQVSVFTPTPGGGTTAGATFTITQPPTPTVTAVVVSGSSATSTPACSASNVTLQVTGTNFENGSVVNWNGSPLSNTTAFVSATQLTAVVPFTDLIAQGTAAITVSTGSAVSNSVNFSLTAPSSLPAPVVATSSPLAPSSAMVGSSQFTLIVTGTSFKPCSVIQWNGSPRTTAYLNPTQLSTQISAADLATAGMVPVTVFTPAPGGGTSKQAVFTISALSIGVASVLGSSPAATATPYCAASGFTLDVTSGVGTTFTSDTVVNWNGSPRPTTFVSATELQAAITYADTAFPGSVSITVSNSVSTSAAAAFTLSTPASLPLPAITALSPQHAAAGSAAFTLSVTGTGLLPCSTVQWNGSARTTTYASPGLTASIAAADVASANTDQVTVNTPAPTGCTGTCGGTSNAASFIVYPPVPGAMRIAAAVQQDSAPGGGSGSKPPLLALHLVSADHRYAVHVLASTDGVTEVPGTTQNIFVRDTCAGAPSGCTPSEKLVSVGVGGNLADGGSFSPSISADGRFVAFLSSARDLVDGDTNGVADVFVRDTCAGAAAGCTPSTQRISVASDGSEANGPSTSATINATGRYVTFESSATNLDSTTTPSFFLRDTCAGASAACVASTAPLD